MGCVSGVQAEKRQFKEKEQGYSTQQFLRDYLIPMDAYACNLPHDDKHRSKLPQELFDFHVECEEYYDQLETLGSKFSGRRPEVPSKAFCLVRLLTIDIDKTLGSTLDLMEPDCKLQVKLKGAVLIPRTAGWLGPPKAGNKSALLPGKGQEGEEEPMRLHLEVWAIVHALKALDEDGHLKIAVDAKQAIFKTNGHAADPMVDCWLPINDFLACVSMVLTKKIVYACGQC